jgi:Putative transposase of IS4/5 family (DUF4096)/Secretion system C-terminal sorting domain
MQEKYKYLTDSQWKIIAEFLPFQRKRKLNLRNIVDAILWLDRTGTQWRNLPECYSPFELVVYPNPADEYMMVAFDLIEAQNFDLRLFDMSGRMVYSQSGASDAGENVVQVLLNGMSGGVYLLDFQSGAFRAQKRVVIAK